MKTDLAVRYARLKHRNEWRLTWEPYIVHPMNVMKSNKKLRLWGLYEQVAILHDVYENCWVQIEEIEVIYWATVANLEKF